MGALMRALLLVGCAVGVAHAQAPPPQTPAQVSPQEPGKGPTLAQLGGPPISLFETIVGLIIERNMTVPDTTPRLKAQVRVTLDESGAIIAHAMEKSSGDAGFDATVIQTVRLFQLTGKERLPVPTDPKLRTAALGAGLVIPITNQPRRAAKKSEAPQ